MSDEAYKSYRKRCEALKVDPDNPFVDEYDPRRAEVQEIIAEYEGSLPPRAPTPEYWQGEWPREGIETLQQLAAYVERRLEIVECADTWPNPNPEVGGKLAAEAERNARIWLWRRGYGAPQQSGNVEARLNNLLRFLGQLTDKSTEEATRQPDSKTDNDKNSPMNLLPDNDEVRKLAKEISRKLGTRGYPHKKDVAIELTNGDEKKANNLLRQLQPSD